MGEGMLVLPADVLKPGRYGARMPGGSAVRLGERPLGELMQLSGRGNGFSNRLGSVLSGLGVDSAPDFGEVAVGDNGLEVLRLAPDRLWLRSPPREAGVRQAKALDLALAANGLDLEVMWKLDLSQSRAVIVIEGAGEGCGAEDLLARLISLDCDASMFEPGSFEETVLHDVSVLVQRKGLAEFEILVPVTWAQSLWSYVREAALPLGYEISSSN